MRIIVLRYWLLLTFLASFSDTCIASEYGIGMTLNTSVYYVPVNLSSHARMEIFAQYNKYTESPTSGLTSEGSNAQYGVGVFRLSSRSAYVVYYGLRLSYVEVASNSKSVSLSGGSITSGYISEDKRTGYEIAPLLGLEYRFSQHVSLAGEVGYSYQNVKGTDQFTDLTNSATSSTNDVSNKHGNSFSQVLMRYYF